MNVLDPVSWLLKADRDMGLAQTIFVQTLPYPDLICYHCQQAAEKYLKALVVHHGLPLRKTHDLEALLDLLQPSEPKIGEEHYNHALMLNVYSTGIRYPSQAGDPTLTDVKIALAAAEFFQIFSKSILFI